MDKSEIVLSALAQRFAICRLPKDVEIPGWATDSSAFNSVTRTSEEISIVCDEASVPADVKAVKGWRAFMVQGPLDLSMTGVIASLTSPLAAVGISVFTLSTYDTDYLLVKSESYEEAVKVLSGFCEIRF